MNIHVRKTVPIEYSQVVKRRPQEIRGKTQCDKTSEPSVVLSLGNGILLKRIKNNTSRMTGDCHVRFCERLGGETPPCLLGAYAVNYYERSISGFSDMPGNKSCE